MVVVSKKKFFVKFCNRTASCSHSSLLLSCIQLIIFLQIRNYQVLP